MKTSRDPRHLSRIKKMQALFEFGFGRKRVKLITPIIKNLTQLDKLISGAASEWPIPKIAKVDLAILRLAVYELMIDKKEPPKVVIDEAVEIAKEFGNSSSPGFVNGVLGTILKKV